MQGYMISFAVTLASPGGIGFSNKLVVSERMPTFAEIRELEYAIRESHPSGATGACALSIIPLEG